MTNDNIKDLALGWCAADNPNTLPGDYYCAGRDEFGARVDNLSADLRANAKMDDGDIYMVAAVVGEIGNNSFDHNIGNWPDVPGVFFGWSIGDSSVQIILADRGQGVMATLKKIKPEISSHKEALKTAFFERISGRAPENRGNGLKFVREGVKAMKIHLTFISGDARAELNQDFKISAAEQNIRGCLAIIEIQKL